MRPWIRAKTGQLVAVARAVEDKPLAVFLNRVRQRHTVGFAVRPNRGQHAVFRSFQIRHRLFIGHLPILAPHRHHMSNLRVFLPLSYSFPAVIPCLSKRSDAKKSKGKWGARPLLE